MIGLSALFTSCITPAASWPTAARRRSRARASWSASSSACAPAPCARVARLPSRRARTARPCVALLPRALWRAASSTVTSRSTVTAPRIFPCSSYSGFELTSMITGAPSAPRRTASVSPRTRSPRSARAVGCSCMKRLVPSIVRGRSSCQSSRSVDGWPDAMVLLRLRVRAHRASVGVEHAHRIGDDVEDRLELRDVAAQRFAQLFSLADVVAGEEQSAARRTRRSTSRTSSRSGAGRRGGGTARASAPARSCRAPPRRSDR